MRGRGPGGSAVLSGERRQRWWEAFGRGRGGGGGSIGGGGWGRSVR